MRTEFKRPTETTLFADAAQVNDFQSPASPANPMLEEWYYVELGHQLCRRSAITGTATSATRKRPTWRFATAMSAWEAMVPGSLDRRLPSQFVGCLRGEILTLP